MLQDNQSAILLEHNGSLSSTQRTKHLNSRYFYVKDVVANKEIAFIWYSTDKVVADYLTKPLTGEKIHAFRLNFIQVILRQEFMYQKLCSWFDNDQPHK